MVVKLTVFQLQGVAEVKQRLFIIQYIQKDVR